MTIEDGPSPTVRCCFCNKLADLDHAIAIGWLPSFWITDDEPCDGAACEVCRVDHLDSPPDNDPIVKPDHARFIRY